MKICPVGAELHANRQTDRHEANIHFSQFCEHAKNWCALHQQITLFFSAS